MVNDGWVNRDLYPFRSHWMEVDGGQMHYVDEGHGPAILLVHGTPTWSFLYRDFIRSLSRSHRVVAPDHLGFGLSDKPQDWSYRPADHARNLTTLIERLELHDITLVVHDFGGPIGLFYALERPERVQRLVLFNTWMWSLAGTPAEKVSRFMGGPIGRFLYRRLNFSPKVLVRAAFGDKSKLTREVHRHYIDPFPVPEQRQAPWVLARELVGSGEWYARLWEMKAPLADKPALLLWGMRDPTFGPAALERWRQHLPAAQVVEFPDAGHFVQEEAPEEAARAIEAFLRAPVSSR